MLLYYVGLFSCETQSPFYGYCAGIPIDTRHGIVITELT